MKQGKGVLWMVLGFILVMLMILTGIQGVFEDVSAYTVDPDPPVHEYMVDRASELYALSYLGAIKGGARCEDIGVDHVSAREASCITHDHFWDADNGPGDPCEASCLLVPPPIGPFHLCCDEGYNAWQRAEVYWGMAVGEYLSGQYHDGYHYLGHVAHLLADMSIPCHAHEDAHPGDGGPDDDCYEDWMEDNYELNDDEKADLLELGLVVIPDGVDPLYYLFYTMNQIADFFASDGTNCNGDPNGDTVDNWGGWMNDVYTELGMYAITSPRTTDDLADNDDGDNDAGGDLSRIRHYSYKFAIRATAALFKYFDDTVSARRALTVVINNVVAKDCHDELMAYPYYNADFFVEVYFNDARYWNEGDQVYNSDGISPGWAFGRDVGLNGSVAITIRLWDEDEAGTGGGDDDQSDIDPAEDGNGDLNFNVDLATGAISGEVSGTCGTPITVEGEDEDDNDESIMTFTVILPNIPPTADAGDDQTVYEGDTVTLEGTFTDPNVGDTHTFLWHMESSTNGQVIPDSAGPAFPEPSTQPFGFVPCDNGVYNFSFTVTDNWGAQGSDAVAVTALNVPPVVTDVYISNQENGEFILPVVHNTSFEGTFTDAGTCDTHTAVWHWGDGTTSGAIIAESGGSGTASGSHIYSLPGDYTVMLTVTDDDGGTNYDTVTVHVADVDEALDIFNAHILSLPASSFRVPITANLYKAAFKTMFLRLDVMLAVHNYPGMIYFMNFHIRTKFDGLVGGGSKDDWIKQDLAIQTELCQKVDDITAYLTYLVFFS